MKSMILRVAISACLFISISAAQNNDDDSFEQTSRDIEQLVERIVSQIEKNFDRMTNERSSRVESEVDERAKSESTSPDAVTFNGNTEISEIDTIQGDLVVKNGFLTIRGAVEGDVLVVNGDILLKSSSRIRGNVRAMNGRITKEDGATIEGYTEESSTSPRRERRKNTMRAQYSYSFKPYFWNSESMIDDNFLFRYNRVEGVFIGFGSEKKYYWDGYRSLSGYGSFGYGFASHRWRIQFGLDRQFAVSEGVLLEIGGEAHSLTDTKDDWIMNLGENNLSSIFFREDFRDYYQREGYSVHSARYTKEGDISTMIDLRYHNDRYASVDNGTNWAIFGGSTFRSNPAINAGTMKSVSMSMGISTVEKYRSYASGWNAFARGEYGGNQLGGDFDMTHLVVDLRRFQPLSSDDQLNIRVRMGSLEGSPIVQKMFELGGANTIPAYGFKEFTGNRMLLTNVEYRMSGEIIDDLLFWPNSLSLILFGDAGVVSNVSTRYAVYDGFNTMSSSSVKSDYGFALAWHDGEARLGFAWRTDKPAPVSIFFRLHKAF